MFRDVIIYLLIIVQRFLEQRVLKEIIDYRDAPSCGQLKEELIILGSVAGIAVIGRAGVSLEGEIAFERREEDCGRGILFLLESVVM